MTALREFVAELLESEGAVVDAGRARRARRAWRPSRCAPRWAGPSWRGWGLAPSAPAGAISDRPRGRLARPLRRPARRARPHRRAADRGCPRAVAAPSDPERLIDGALSTAERGLAAARASSPAGCRCLLLAFRYTAVSDEKREGLVWLGFNCSDRRGARRRHAGGSAAGAGADGRTGRRPSRRHRRAAGPLWDAATIAARAGPLLDQLVRADLEPFLRRHAPPPRPRPPPRARLSRRSAPGGADEARRSRASGSGGVEVEKIRREEDRREACGEADKGEKRGADRARAHARRRDRARVRGQARRPAPQLRAERDGRVGAGAGAAARPCIATMC